MIKVEDMAFDMESANFMGIKWMRLIHVICDCDIINYYTKFLER